MEVKPADIISGVETLRNAITIHECWDFQTKTTISSGTYLKWAQRGYDQDDCYGFNNCISNAKLAVCSKLDNLLVANHIGNILRKNYPYKIEVLEQIGISIPSVVHDLIIDPRNELEHEYVSADRKLAKDALGVAQLVLSGISDDFGGMTALNWTAIMYLDIVENCTEFPGWNNRDRSRWPEAPVLFVDVFDEISKVRLIDEISQEMRVAELAVFTIPEAITFAQLLRSIHKHEKGIPLAAGGSVQYVGTYQARIYKNG